MHLQCLSHAYLVFGLLLQSMPVLMRTGHLFLQFCNGSLSLLLEPASMYAI